MTPYAEVIGDPVAHSKSPLIHRFWLEALGMPGDYRATHVTPAGLADHVAVRAGDPAWRGCNVTLPHKVAVTALVDDPGDVAGSIGAMNTLLRDPAGRVSGTNTDAAGFFAPIAAMGWRDKPVAVVGSGGAARAVLFALARTGVGEVTLIARNEGAGAQLLDHFGLRGRVVPLDTRPEAALLVQTTSLGMAGQPPYAPDLSAMPSEAVVYDIVYAPLETPLLAAARARGLVTIDGLEMLIGQAAVAFELFFGAAPPRARDAELRARLMAS